MRYFVLAAASAALTVFTAFVVVFYGPAILWMLAFILATHLYFRLIPRD